MLARPHAVSVDSLIGQLWGEHPPASVMTTLQAYVSGLRRTLEPDRKPRQPASVLLTRVPGYVLDLVPGTVDADVFESVVTDADARRDTLSGMTAEGLEQVDADLADALSLWRGEAYADLGDAAVANGPAWKNCASSVRNCDWRCRRCWADTPRSPQPPKH